MDDPRTDFFFDQLTGLLDASGQPAAVMDHDFRLVWCSAAGSREMPALALPDGAQLLLHGYDPEVVRAEIDRCGSFTTAGPNHLFAERPTVICALPDGSGRYLIQPVSGAEQGSGMRPEGMSRTLSSFGNQYRAPLTVIFSMLTLLSRNCGPGSSEKDRERMPDYLAAINQSAFRLLRSSEWISDYTRLTYGFSPVRTRRVDLFHYLRELFSAAADLIEPTGIPLSADIPGGMLARRLRHPEGVRGPAQHPLEFLPLHPPRQPDRRPGALQAGDAQRLGRRPRTRDPARRAAARL